MLILIQLCALLYNGSDPLTMCMFTDAALGFHFALAGIHVTLEMIHWLYLLNLYIIAFIVLM